MLILLAQDQTISHRSALPDNTDQPEKLEKIHIGVEFVFDDLQSLWR